MPGFSTYESTQFINGVLDAIKQDIENSAEPAPEGDTVAKNAEAGEPSVARSGGG